MTNRNRKRIPVFMQVKCLPSFYFKCLLHIDRLFQLLNKHYLHFLLMETSSISVSVKSQFQCTTGDFTYVHVSFCRSSSWTVCTEICRPVWRICPRRRDSGRCSGSSPHWNASSARPRDRHELWPLLYCTSAHIQSQNEFSNTRAFRGKLNNVDIWSWKCYQLKYQLTYLLWEIDGVQ